MPSASGATDGAASTLCSGCGQALDASARFCPNCGTARPSSEAATSTLDAGERRRLTILFCDLVGSTALSEQLDPEELGELVLGYQEMGRAVVKRFGGHIAQYLGDGLLAYFGYPSAHEDDAERAVLAGLAILEGLDALNATAPASRERLEARVGIHAGPAIVGEMGSADRSDTSAFGSTPNIAARLESVAAPHTVVVSDEVRRFLDPRFELTDRGTRQLKGIARPVRVWEVGHVGEREARLATRCDLPMFGREREFQQLVDALARADAGKAQLVTVSAEPGIGKTRLLQALYEHVEGSASGAVWLEGQCSELTASTPLASVVQFLRRALGLEEALDNDERASRVRDALAMIGSDSAQVSARYIADLLGVDAGAAARHTNPTDESPELTRRRTLDSLAAWVRALAADQTVVVAVEDVHWSDPTTIELLELITERDARVLCICTARTEAQLAWRAPGRVSTITLLPLGAVEAEDLTRALAVGRELPSEVLDAIAQRGDGVPLFIEELVSAASDKSASADAAEVPTTLHALLASRLDLLGDVRYVAQAAAVLGREFPRGLLAAVTTATDDELIDALERLVTAGILMYRQTPGGIAYAFRHALIQDAAYDSLLRRQRRALHDVAANELMAGFADLVASSPEVVARHLHSAERRLEAGAWFEAAGRRAAERAALREARAHFEQGIAVLEELDASPERSQLMMSLHVLLGNTLMGSSGIGYDAAGPVWERAVEFAELVGDGKGATAALNGLAVFHADRGDLAATDAYVDRILAIAERDGCRIAELRGHGSRGMVRLYQARGEESRRHLQHAASLSRDGDFFTVTFGFGHDEETFFCTMNAWTSWWIGRPDEALDFARRAVATAERIPSSLSQAMARHALTITHLLRGEPADAAAVARENFDLVTALDFPYWRGIAQMELGAALAGLGDEQGLATIREALEALTTIGNAGGSPFGMALLADAYFAVGCIDDALGMVDVGLAMSELLGQPFCDTELLAARGRGLLAWGRDGEAFEAFEQSLEVGRRQRAASATLRTVVAFAPQIARDDPDRARALLRDALGAMGDGFDTVDQRAARAQLGQLVVPT